MESHCFCLIWVLFNTAPTVTTAMKTFESGDDLLHFGRDQSVAHVRCGPHTLQLVPKAVLFETSANASANASLCGEVHKVLAKCRAFVTLIHKSPITKQRFLGYVKELFPGSAVTTIPNDCQTRWNSTYVMIEALLNSRAAVDRTIATVSQPGASATTRLSFLSEEDWCILAQVKATLTLWSQATTELQSKDGVSISTYLPFFQSLLAELLHESLVWTYPKGLYFDPTQVLEALARPSHEDVHLIGTGADAVITVTTSVESLPQAVIDFRKAMLDNFKSKMDRKLDKQQVGVYQLAAALDPRFKGGLDLLFGEEDAQATWGVLTQLCLETLPAEPHPPVAHQATFGAMFGMKAKRPAQVPLEAVSGSKAGATLAPPPAKKFRSAISHSSNPILARLREACRGEVQQDKAETPEQKIRKEVMDYKKVTVGLCYEESEKGVLKWWREQDQFPHVAMVARKYLSIQASSAEVICCVFWGFFFWFKLSPALRLLTSIFA